MLISQ
jgi:inosine-uridine nucleoside N-ribohydrolase